MLRNQHVHDVGEEIVKIQGLRTHDVRVEDCIVHTNLDWSGIDVQGTWGGTPDPADRPYHIVIRHNLIFDIPGFAGVGNEIADGLHVLDNVVLGAAIGLAIGCGNYNVLHNNLITSYDHFNELHGDASYSAIDLSSWEQFSPAEIDGFADPSCLDGIALSGNFMSLVQEFIDIYDTEFDWLAAYDVAFDPEVDLDGQRQGSLWDLGAYLSGN